MLRFVTKNFKKKKKRCFDGFSKRFCYEWCTKMLISLEWHNALVTHVTSVGDLNSKVLEVRRWSILNMVQYIRAKRWPSWNKTVRALLDVRIIRGVDIHYVQYGKAINATREGSRQWYVLYTVIFLTLTFRMKVYHSYMLLPITCVLYFHLLVQLWFVTQFHLIKSKHLSSL